jgi:hypothetical protein
MNNASIDEVAIPMVLMCSTADDKAEQQQRQQFGTARQPRATGAGGGTM